MDVFFSDENLVGLIYPHLETKDAMNFSFSYTKARKSVLKDYPICMVIDYLNHPKGEPVIFLKNTEGKLDKDFWRRYFSLHESYWLFEWGIREQCIDVSLLKEMFEDGMIKESSDGKGDLNLGKTTITVCMC